VNKRAPSWLLVVSTAILAWLSILDGVVSLVASLIFVGIVGWLIRRRRWRQLAALLVTSPFALATTYALVSYSRGAARSWTVGLPGSRFYNVDPATRYQSLSSGCIVTGSEWVLQLPNNLTLLALHSILGPMPGAYDGPYPQPDGVRQALRSASALSWANLEHDDLTIGEATFRLRRGVGSGLAAILRPTSSG
jgi:hypothetical protein